MTSRIVLAVISLVLSFSLTLNARAETIPVCPALDDSTQFGPNDYLKGTFAGKDGWLSAPSDLNQTFDPPDVEQLKRLVDALKAKGTQLVVVVMPTRPIVYPEKMPDGALTAEELAFRQNKYRALIESIRNSGALATDNLDVLLEAKANGNVFFPTDTHWTILGARSVAAAVADVIRSQPGFTSSNLSFVDKPQATKPFNGAYQIAVEQACGDNKYLSPEIQEIVTEKVPFPNEGLFDEVNPPKIVISGTSYSWRNGRDQFNFGGALQQYSGEEVLNVSVSGGGLYSSLFNYLSSNDFHQSPPKYLIWETSRAFQVGSTDKIGHLIATINGQCAEDAALTQTSEDGKPVQFSMEAGSNVLGPDYYLAMQFDDRSITSADIEFRADNNKASHITVALPSEADSRGELFADVPRRFGNIRAIVVSPKQASGKRFSVSLCSNGVSLAAGNTVASPLQQISPTGALTTVKSDSSPILQIMAFGEVFQGSPILAIELDGVVVLRQPIDATSRSEPQKVTLTIPAGTSKMRMRLDNDINNGRGQDRNIQIVSVAIEGKVILANTLTGAGSSARILENGDYRITGGSKWTQVPLSALGASVADQSCSKVSSIEVGPFRTGDVTVPQSSSDQLKAIVAALKDNQTCSVTLTGWSSASGSVARNLELAKARATTVSQLLKRLGVTNQVTLGAPQILTEGGPIVRLEYGTAP